LRSGGTRTASAVLDRDPLEDSFVDQPAKTVGENLPRDPEISLELIESTQSQQSVPNDQQRPSFADYLEGARD
jgi:hypothetical protein